MDHLRAGVALFNDGHYLAAHEPWEERWLESPAGERDDCVQGLVQATAATYKSRIGNWSGAVGLAESGVTYLERCEDDELGVDVEVAPLVRWLERLAADPELGERERPPALRLDGSVVETANLTFPAAAVAIEAIAETRGDEVLEQALEYAEADLEAGDETSPFVTLTLDFLHGADGTVRRRLEEHVERRASRDADVDGLFD